MPLTERRGLRYARPRLAIRALEVGAGAALEQAGQTEGSCTTVPEGSKADVADAVWDADLPLLAR